MRKVEITEVPPIPNGGAIKELMNRKDIVVKARNYAGSTEIIIFEYKRMRQSFDMVNLTTTKELSDSFWIPSRYERIIHSGNRTIVFLDDGTKGMAKCGENDTYNKQKGTEIAYRRAKIKSLQKELKKLTK